MLKVHPAAELFPLMEGEEFECFVEDIRDHGQRDPITVHQGAILDGRNRYRALQQLGREPMTIEWDGKGTPEEFVASMNLHRRHLSASQRAMIAARLVTSQLGHNRFTVAPVNTGPKVTIPAAARMLGVDKSQVDDARAVLRRATDDEIAAVDAGDIGVRTLADQIRASADPKERVKQRAESGRSRIETARQNTALWQELKTALLAINNLPQPADMVPVVRAWDRSKLTDQQLLRALKWLEGFADAWTRADAA